MNHYTRRRFLKLGGKTIAGAGLALGANPLQALAQATSGSATDSDYRALVCVYLKGGCDGFSLMVPTGAFEHQEYTASRGNLAVPRNSLIGLNGGAEPLGLHPSAAALQPLYDQNKLAIIANIGNLLEPTTREQYLNKLVSLPSQLFSHSDQSIQWQQLQGRGNGEEGWGARAASYLQSFQERDYLTSISLAGSNYWQSGTNQRPFSLTESGVLQYSGMDFSDDWQQPRAQAFERVRDLPRDHMFAAAYADLQKRAANITTELGVTLDGNAALFTDVPEENSLASKLSMVAQLIAAQQTLGMRRQIFYVTMSGYDVHDNQGEDHPVLFEQLAEALSYFQGKMVELGQEPNVTTFTASDFGRSLLSNGDGTDHGWGNHLMAMGGAVNGGQIYGNLPSLDVEGPDSVHRGRILPTLSATQYAATLLQWLGLTDAELDTVLPGLNNFSNRNLNFLV